MSDRIYKTLCLGFLLGNILCCTACANTANKDTSKQQSDVLLLKDIKQEDTSMISIDSTGIFMYQGMIIKL